MKEFIVLLAYLMALVALSIDAMLPALGIMASDLGVARPNDIQLVVSSIFIGLTVGQLLCGPVSDAIGRKRMLYIGMALFVVGSLISYAAASLPIMLLGRAIQGLGVAAPRIVVVAIARDKYHGRDMAAVMSLVMGVFIMVPAIAPALGELIIHVASWRSIFLFYIAATFVAFLWAHFRLEETLPPQNRRSFCLKTLWQGVTFAARHRVTLGYTICSGLAFGALLGYLNSAQQIFQGLFHVGDMFALYFGLLALAIGSSFFSNSALVRKHGMRKLTRVALRGLIIGAALFVPYTLLMPPSLWVLMLFLAYSFFCLGLTFGNMNAMAMEPMGHMAGLGSAFVGAGSSLISLVLGAIIGQSYNGTLLPLAMGFLTLSLAARATMIWTERSHA